MLYAERMFMMKARQESCCFSGHRPEKLPWREDESDPRCLELKTRIAAALDRAYDKGYRNFLCGMARGCDWYFCEQVIQLRKRRAGVYLEAAIPYPEHGNGWSEENRRRYQTLLAACDEQFMVSTHYHRGCLQKRDRYIVDHASLLIAAFNGQPGGTQYTMRYAIRQGIEVDDLHVETLESISAAVRDI